MTKLFGTIICSAIVLGSAQTWAGGYEKTVGWSAHWSSLAGAASSAVSGADALYFNPAGMVADDAMNELSVNVSPSFIEFKGPNVPKDGSLSNKADQQTSELSLSPFAGVLYKRKVGEKFAVGAGFYAAGGSNVEYKDVDFFPVTEEENVGRNTAIKSSIKITEASLGGAWRYSKNLTFGAAWRMVMATGEIETVKTDGFEFNKIALRDLEGSSSGGVRLGVQYTSDDGDFGAGLSFRNEVELKLDGKFLINTDGDDILHPAADAKITNSFPTQYSFGLFKKLDDRRTLFHETSLSQYSVNKEVALNSELGITQNWEDQWSFKFGYEQMGARDMVWRAGYAYTTNVVPENYARSTFSSPGPGHSFLVGGGKELRGGKYAVDVAAEYSFSSGKGKHDVKDEENSAITGDYEAVAYALHGSFKYRF